MQVSVVIVNFNTRDLLRNCLRSVFSQTKDVEFEVIVSDNGSIDGSVEMVRQEFPQVVLVENKANLGFGPANNRGVKVAKGEFIFYLNSDTLLLNNAIKLFYDYWKAHETERLGAIGCNLVDGERKISHSYGSFPTAFFVLKKMILHVFSFYSKNVFKAFGADMRKHQRLPVNVYKTGNVDYVTGADLFVKNDPKYLYDESFFLYFEETDMQYRMMQDGLIRRVIEGPSVAHLVRGGAERPDDVLLCGTFSLIQSEISKVRFTKKHLSKTVALLLKFMISAIWFSPYILKNTRKHFKALWSV